MNKPVIIALFIAIVGIVNHCHGQSTQPDPVTTAIAAISQAHASDQATIGTLQQKLAATTQATAAATTQPAIPAAPADVIYAPAMSVYVSPDGNDTTGDGTAAHPFATYTPAIAAVHAWHALAGNAAQLAGVYVRADGTYLSPGYAGEPHLVWGSYGASSIEQRPTIIGKPGQDMGGWVYLNAFDVHWQNLRIKPDPALSDLGIYVNGGSNVTIDYCEIDGFRRFDLDLVGIPGVRLYHNFIANAYDSSKSTMSCSGLYTELPSPDVECNIFYHNGWRAPFDLTDGTWIAAIMFRHGWYENPNTGAVGGIDRFNLYLRNAATGHQCRAGNGNVQWSVFWDNGNAVDVFTGSGLSNVTSGEIGHCAFFGNLTRDFACYGGGASGQSALDNLHDLLFAGSALSMQLDPAIGLQWNPQDHNGLAAPAAPSLIRNCRGIWPGGDVSLSGGRTATINNVVIRKPLAGEHVPTLLDYLGVPDDASAAELLRTHLHDPKYSAQAINLWLAGKLAA